MSDIFLDHLLPPKKMRSETSFIFVYKHIYRAEKTSYFVVWYFNITKMICLRRVLESNYKTIGTLCWSRAGSWAFNHARHLYTSVLVRMDAWLLVLEVSKSSVMYAYLIVIIIIIIIINIYIFCPIRDFLNIFCYHTHMCA